MCDYVYPRRKRGGKSRQRKLRWALSDLFPLDCWVIVVKYLEASDTGWFAAVSMQARHVVLRARRSVVRLGMSVILSISRLNYAMLTGYKPTLGVCIFAASVGKQDILYRLYHCMPRDKLSSDVLLAAAEAGHRHIVLWGMNLEFPWHSAIPLHYARIGMFDIVLQMVEAGKAFHRSTIGVAIVGGHFKAYKAMFDRTTFRHMEMYQLVDGMGMGGNAAIIDHWFDANPCAHSRVQSEFLKVANTATREGHLGAVSTLVRRGYYPDDEAYKAAKGRGHMDVVRFLQMGSFVRSPGAWALFSRCASSTYE